VCEPLDERSLFTGRDQIRDIEESGRRRRSVVSARIVLPDRLHRTSVTILGAAAKVSRRRSAPRHADRPALVLRLRREVAQRRATFEELEVLVVSEKPETYRSAGGRC